MKVNRRGHKQNRNDRLIMDYKNEMPIKEMEKKYKIGRSRIYQIIREY